jgi:hypothetical protein
VLAFHWLAALILPFKKNEFIGFFNVKKTYPFLQWTFNSTFSKAIKITDFSKNL